MNYESRDANAMILPIPVRQPAHSKSLRFIDLQDYGDFFEDLADGFPYTSPSLGIGCSKSEVAPFASVLEVFEVGSYIASFVPKLSDFARLDSRFTLPDEIWSQIPQYADYGFAVFQLASGSLKPHPMAFEFESDNSSIYFPTIHIHDGSIHDSEEFDHVLYLQHAGFDSQVYGYQNSDVADKATGLIRSKYVASRFSNVGRANGVVDANLLVHRKIIQGRHPNRDTFITTSGDPANPTLNLRPWLSYSPWLIVVGALTWFLARRARIKGKKTATTNSPPAA